MKNKISVMLVEYTDVTDVFWYKGHKGTRRALVKQKLKYVLQIY